MRSIEAVRRPGPAAAGDPGAAAKGGWGRPVAAATLAAFAIGTLGRLATDIGPWYQGLRKPSWQPPDFLFGPVWTTIYALAIAAAAIAWRATADRSRHRRTIGLFALNGVVNVLWSYLFFTLKRPDWALVEVGCLWASILLLIVYLGRFSKASGWLLLPYLAWVSFASVLNWTIVHLNGPFGTGSGS